MEAQGAIPDTGVRYFQDFAVGDVYDHGGLVLTPQRYAHYLHLFEETNAYYGRASASLHPAFVFHHVFGLSVHDISYHAQANLEYATLKHLRPVRAGELLMARSRVVGIEAKGSSRGIVYVETQGLRADGALALVYRRWVLVHQDSARAPSVAQAPPAISRELPLAELAVPWDGSVVSRRGEQPLPLDQWLDGTWRILPAPKVVDMVVATQLPVMTLNNAKPHYEGAQLVYGGCVISIAHAQLTRLIGPFIPVGWNTARHYAPTFPGQVLSSRVQFLSKADFPARDDLDLVRLKLSTERAPTEDERAKAAGPVQVLSMDIFIVLKRR